MEFDLIKIWHEMGIFARLIVITLAIMAGASLAVFVERLWVFFRSQRASRRFARQAAELLGARDYPGFVKAAGDNGSHLAGLLGTGVRTWLDARQNPGEVAPPELARRELERRADAMSADVRRGMSVLASVGSISPFVGLLGTVVGIIASFQGIARDGSGGLGAVSAGIAEALVVTAFGLLVAIPAVLAFNFLSTRADKLMQALDQARGELADHLENQGGLAASSSPGPLRDRAAA
jgi:biopolymer transport protein ExbB